MDCRKAVVSSLAVACLVAAGCVTTRGEVGHQARTVVAFGDMQANGGFTGETTPEQQAVFRHEAQLAYLEGIKIDPKYLPAYLGLARLQKATGDHVAALGTYQQALQVEERNAGLWHEVGMVQCKLRQWDAGIASLKKAIEFDPSNGQYRSALGCSQVMAGRTQEGFATLAAAKGEARAHADMAKLMAHQGQAEAARTHLAEAARLDPSLAGPGAPAKDETPRGEVMQAGYVALAPSAPPALPTIIQAGVVQPKEPTSPAAPAATPAAPAPAAAPAKQPIDVPPLPVLSIRGK